MHSDSCVTALRQINPSGKISLFRKPKSPVELPPSCPLRNGRWPSSPNVGMGCGGRVGIVREMGLQGGINSVSGLQDVLTSGADAYGEIVWSWRRKAGAKRANLFAGDGGNRA